MIPVPDAQAAYDRVTHLIAQPGDVDLVIAAAQQGGMPPPIVDIGTVLKTDKDAYEAYQINPSIPNTQAWIDADAATREALKNHLDV
jgi:hypothetical protein